MGKVMPRGSFIKNNSLGNCLSVCFFQNVLYRYHKRVIAGIE